MITDLIRKARESPFPGGMAHACELETSVYLYLNEGAVQMDKAEKEIGFHPSKYYWHDLGGGPPLRMVELGSRLLKAGVIGDPTLATRDKVKLWCYPPVQTLIDV